MALPLTSHLFFQCLNLAGLTRVDSIGGIVQVRKQSQEAVKVAHVTKEGKAGEAKPWTAPAPPGQALLCLHDLRARFLEEWGHSPKGGVVSYISLSSSTEVHEDIVKQIMAPHEQNYNFYPNMVLRLGI